MREIGIEVTQVASPATSQDGVYTANWGLIRGHQVVLSRLPNVRESEENYARSIFEDLGLEVHIVPDGYKFSGQGDALPLGDLLLAGKNYRSDPQAQEFAARTLGYELIQLECLPQISQSGSHVINPITKWPDSFFYDLDLAIAVLDETHLAYCPKAFTEESRNLIESLPDIHKIAVSYNEAIQNFALNLISDGQNVILNQNALKLKGALFEIGKTTFGIDATELSKGGGFIRCISLTFNE
jgi:N-dimethylarginine dimethylaminohydrolase